MGKMRLDENQRRSLVEEQDLKIIRALASNNQKVREKALKSLRKWFEHRSLQLSFTENDFTRVWTGLFYSMWMADKPLVQEENAENIAKLVLHFSNVDTSLLFFKCAMDVLTKEWFGIDNLRLDKFLMFVRRILRHVLIALKNSDWEIKAVEDFSDILLQTVLKNDNSTYLGLTMHIIEIFLEELAKVSEGEIDEHTAGEFIRPFIKYLAVLSDSRLLNHMQRFFFYHLLNQTDEGIEYSEKFEVWRNHNFAGGSIDALQKVEDDEDSDEEGHEDEEKTQRALDPRAGRVDVELPQIKFNPDDLAEMLLSHRFTKGSNKASRRFLTKLATKFQLLSNGNFPLGLKTIKLPNRAENISLKKSVKDFMQFEDELLDDSTRNRKRKKYEEKHGLQTQSKKPKIETERKIKAKTSKNSKTEEKERRKIVEVKEKERRKTVKIKEKEPKVTLKVKNKNKPLSTNLFENQLMKFIQRSEGVIKKPKKKKNNLKKLIEKLEDWEYENRFRRNSGTWVVHKHDISTESQTSFSSVAGDSFSVDPPTPKVNGETNITEPNNTPEIKSELNGFVTTEKSKFPKRRKSIDSSESSKNHNSSTSIHSPKKSPSLRENSVPNSLQLFEQSEWDFPPNEGEVEIFVPSNKFKKKMEQLAKGSGKELGDVLADSIHKLAKTRYSLNETSLPTQKKRLSDSRIVKNPFAMTPKGEKRVKINVKLNRSQEVYEHDAIVKSSPAIPYDASKKPLKPLLKPSAISSPINPFYKRRLKL